MLRLCLRSRVFSLARSTTFASKNVEINHIFTQSICHYRRSFSNSNDPRNKKDQSSLSDVYSIPNMITITRILSSPLITYAIINDYKTVALAGCISAGLSDWLDGYIAKSYNMRTTLGGILDPLADKVFIGSVAVGLTMQGLIPLPLTALIIIRDVSILTGGLYLRSIEKLPAEKFFDFSSGSTFIIAPTNISKFNTFLQFTLLVSTLSHYIFDMPQLELLQPLWYATGLSTVISGLGYLDGQGIRKFRSIDIKASSNKKKPDI